MNQEQYRLLLKLVNIAQSTEEIMPKLMAMAKDLSTISKDPNRSKAYLARVAARENAGDGAQLLMHLVSTCLLLISGLSTFALLGDLPQPKEDVDQSNFEN